MNIERTISLSKMKSKYFYKYFTEKNEDAFGAIGSISWGGQVPQAMVSRYVDLWPSTGVAMMLTAILGLDCGIYASTLRYASLNARA